MLGIDINFKYDQLYPSYNTSYLRFPYPLPAMWRYRSLGLCFYKVLRHAMFNQLYKAKLQQMFTAEPGKMVRAETEAQRMEDRAGWSKPTNRIKFRNRPSTRLIRMRNNKGRD